MAERRAHARIAKNKLALLMTYRWYMHVYSIMPRGTIETCFGIIETSFVPLGTIERTAGKSTEVLNSATARMCNRAHARVERR